MELCERVALEDGLGYGAWVWERAVPVCVCIRVSEAEGASGGADAGVEVERLAGAGLRGVNHFGGWDRVCTVGGDGDEGRLVWERGWE